MMPGVLPPPMNGSTAVFPPRKVAAMTFCEPQLMHPEELVALQEVSRKPPEDFVKGVLAQAYQAYRVGTLLVLVAVVDQKLQLLGVLQQGRRGAFFRDLVVRLRQLAAAWHCTVIETSTTNPMVAELLLKVGSTPVATEWHLEMEV